MGWRYALTPLSNHYRPSLCLRVPRIPPPPPTTTSTAIRLRLCHANNKGLTVVAQVNVDLGLLILSSIHHPSVPRPSRGLGCPKKSSPCWRKFVSVSCHLPTVT